MSEQDLQLRREAAESVEKYEKTVNQDPYRLEYHLMPPVGLLNDPNGFIQWNGVYHLFYQWNPYEPNHGAKFWGHYTSTDLVHWKEEEVALTPSSWFDKNGCYSGSAVADDGKLKLIYTGNVKDEHNLRETYQCLAESEDGIRFTKKGVILEKPDGYTAHFRDPKVWKHEGIWYAIIGTQTEKLDGRATLFSSEDLSSWKLMGDITGGNTEQLGDFGYMWECPDVFHLDGKDVLLVSPQGLEPDGLHYHNVYNTGYFVGELNYETGKLTHGDFTELDRGFEFYAPQTTLDHQGRRLMFGWMGVPEQGEDKHPTVKNQWIHTMTIPRVLRLKDGHLYQHPVSELKQLRKKEQVYPGLVLSDSPGSVFKVEGTAVEILLEMEGWSGNRLEIDVRGNGKIIYDCRLKELSLERKSFETGEIEKRACKLEDLRSLQLFLDMSSVEVFANDGQEVFTARLFPDPENKDISVKSVGGSITCTATMWELGI